MTMDKSSTKTRWTLIFGTILALTIVNILFGLAWPSLLTEAGPTLPPRQPPPRAPDEDDNDKDDRPVGAYIELQVQSTEARLWTAVQWQDSVGDWHDVEGWRGILDQNNNKVWWVSAAHFGKGPFRWVIYQEQYGPQLTTSESFNLPKEANQTVTIKVSLLTQKWT